LFTINNVGIFTWKGHLADFSHKHSPLTPITSGLDQRIHSTSLPYFADHKAHRVIRRSTKNSMLAVLFSYIRRTAEGIQKGGDWGDHPPIKPKKITLFTISLCNLENNIRDIRPFHRSLFWHCSFVKYTSSLSQ